jgi:hypothetical protein
MKTGCEINTQLLKSNGVCLEMERRDVDRSDLVLSSEPAIIPGDIEATMNRLPATGVEKPPIPDLVHFRATHCLSRIELAARDIDEVQQASESNSDDLLGYIHNRRVCCI